MRAFKDQRITSSLNKKGDGLRSVVCRRPISKKVWLRASVVIASIVICLTGFELYYKDFLRLISRSISVVEIKTKLVHVSELDVEASLRDLLGKNFFSLDVDKVKSKLEENPWISAAVVTRVWPHTLSLELEEELPIARWGPEHLVNQYGQLFSPKNVHGFANLPSLGGIAGEERVVMSQYRSLNHILSHVELKLVGLRLDTRGGWTLSLSDGLVIFAGRDEILEKVQRFADFYSHQRGFELGQFKTIDLRYSNGLAVRKRAAPLGSLNTNELAIIN
jgi:cell division protein FtsQ